jgi:hypothetical protein
MSPEEAQRLAEELADPEGLAERVLSPEEIAAYEAAQDSVLEARAWAIRYLGDQIIG